jgi:hypothetical protein
VPTDELVPYINRIVRMMLSVEYPWINVPLSVEVSIGQDWHAMREIGIFRSDKFQPLTAIPAPKENKK